MAALELSILKIAMCELLMLKISQTHLLRHHSSYIMLKYALYSATLLNVIRENTCRDTTDYGFKILCPGGQRTSPKSFSYFRNPPTRLIYISRDTISMQDNCISRILQFLLSCTRLCPQ